MDVEDDGLEGQESTSETRKCDANVNILGNGNDPIIKQEPIWEHEECKYECVPKTHGVGSQGEPCWYAYQCCSGETLFYYNLLTGEHIFTPRKCTCIPRNGVEADKELQFPKSQRTIETEYVARPPHVEKRSVATETEIQFVLINPDKHKAVRTVGTETEMNLVVKRKTYRTVGTMASGEWEDDTQNSVFLEEETACIFEVDYRHRNLTKSSKHSKSYKKTLTQDNDLTKKSIVVENLAEVAVIAMEQSRRKVLPPCADEFRKKQLEEGGTDLTSCSQKENVKKSEAKKQDNEIQPSLSNEFSVICNDDFTCKEVISEKESLDIQQQTKSVNNDMQKGHSGFDVNIDVVESSSVEHAKDVTRGTAKDTKIDESLEAGAGLSSFQLQTGSRDENDLHKAVNSHPSAKARVPEEVDNSNELPNKSASFPNSESVAVTTEDDTLRKIPQEAEARPYICKYCDARLPGEVSGVKIHLASHGVESPMKYDSLPKKDTPPKWIKIFKHVVYEYNDQLKNNDPMPIKHNSVVPIDNNHKSILPSRPVQQKLNMTEEILKESTENARPCLVGEEEERSRNTQSITLAVGPQPDSDLVNSKVYGANVAPSSVPSAAEDILSTRCLANEKEKSEACTAIIPVGSQLDRKRFASSTLSYNNEEGCSSPQGVGISVVSASCEKEGVGIQDLQCFSYTGSTSSSGTTSDHIARREESNDVPGIHVTEAKYSSTTATEISEGTSMQKPLRDIASKEDGIALPVICDSESWQPEGYTTTASSSIPLLNPHEQVPTKEGTKVLANISVGESSESNECTVGATENKKGNTTVKLQEGEDSKDDSRAQSNVLVQKTLESSVAPTVLMENKATIALPKSDQQAEESSNNSTQCRVCKKIFKDLRALSSHAQWHFRRKARKSIKRRNLDKVKESLSDSVGIKENDALTRQTAGPANQDSTESDSDFVDKVSYSLRKGTECRCGLCNKTFKNNKALTTHRRIHFRRRRSIRKLVGKSQGRLLRSSTTAVVEIRSSRKFRKPLNAVVGGKGDKDVQYAADNEATISVESQSETERASTNDGRKEKKASYSPTEVKRTLAVNTTPQNGPSHGNSAYREQHSLRRRSEKLNYEETKDYFEETASSQEVSSQNMNSSTLATPIAASSQTLLGCKLCSKTFNDRRKLRDHVRKHKEMKSKTCRYCKRSFTSFSYLLEHTQSHKGIKYPCRTCGKEFTYSSNMYTHRKLCRSKADKGEEEIEFECEISANSAEQQPSNPNIDSPLSIEAECLTDTIEPSKGKLNTGDHCAGKHSGNKGKSPTNKRIEKAKLPSTTSFRCTLCEKSFKEKHVLLQHIEDHKRMKVHSCYICKKSLSSFIYFRKHMKAHDGVKFTCDECGKVFNHSSNMSAHKRTWHPKGVFCMSCAMRFPTRKTLREHKCTQSTGQYIYCEECGTAFTQQKKLVKHMLRHGSVSNVEESSDSEIVLVSRTAKRKRICATSDENIDDKSESTDIDISLVSDEDTGITSHGKGHVERNVKNAEEKKAITTVRDHDHVNRSESVEDSDQHSVESTCSVKRRRADESEKPHSGSQMKRAKVPECQTSCGDGQSKEPERSYSTPPPPAFPFKCSECLTYFAYQWSYDRHLKAKHRKNTPNSDEQHCRDGQSKEPERSYSTPPPQASPFKCSECLTYFAYQWTYDRHLKAKHSERTPDNDEQQKWVCHLCSSVFLAEGGLESHLKAMHANAKDNEHKDITKSGGYSLIPSHPTSDQSAEQSIRISSDKNKLAENRDHSCLLVKIQSLTDKPNQQPNSSDSKNISTEENPDCCLLDQIQLNVEQTTQQSNSHSSKVIRSIETPAGSSSTELTAGEPNHQLNSNYSKNDGTKQIPASCLSDHLQPHDDQPIQQSNSSSSRVIHSIETSYSSPLAQFTAEEPIPQSSSQDQSSQHTCSVCNKEFLDTIALANHFRCHITPKKKYDCNFCGKSFYLYGLLAVHLRSAHRTLAPVKESASLRRSPRKKAKDKDLHQYNHLHLQSTEPHQFSEDDLDNNDDHNRYKRGLQCKLCGVQYNSEKWLGKHLSTYHNVTPSVVEPLCSFDKGQTNGSMKRNPSEDEMSENIYHQQAVFMGDVIVPDTGLTNNDVGQGSTPLPLDESYTSTILDRKSVENLSDPQELGPQSSLSNTGVTSQQVTKLQDPSSCNSGNADKITDKSGIAKSLDVSENSTDFVTVQENTLILATGSCGVQEEVESGDEIDKNNSEDTKKADHDSSYLKNETDVSDSSHNSTDCEESSPSQGSELTKKFICDICGVAYTRQGNLENHKRKHQTHFPSPLGVRSCRVRKVQDDKDALAKAKRNIEIRFVNETETQETIQTVDSERLPEDLEETSEETQNKGTFSCHICGMHYRRPWWLEKHLKSHTTSQLDSNSVLKGNGKSSEDYISRKKQDGHDNESKDVRGKKISETVESVDSERLPESSEDVEKKSEETQNKGAFSCHICGVHYRRPWWLEKHLKSHTTSKDCISRKEQDDHDGESKDVRGKKISETVVGVDSERLRESSEDVEEISEETQNKGAFSCHICGMHYRRPWWLEKHLKSHTTSPLDSKTVLKGNGKSSKDWISRKEQDDHDGESKVAQGKKISQTVDSERLPESSEDLEETSEETQSKGAFSCHICGMHYQRPWWLEKHLKSHTTSPLDSKTVLKGKGKSTKDHISRKKQDVHDGESKEVRGRKFSCDICGVSYTYEASLRNHLLLHESEKRKSTPKRKLPSTDVSAGEKYQCQVCSKEYINRIRFLEHVDSHSSPFKRPRADFSEEPVAASTQYICVTCGDKFVHQDHLDEHVQEAHKKFTCRHCEAIFTCSNDLTAHLRMHTRASTPPKLSCQVCGKTFKNTAKLVVHFRRHTNENSKVKEIEAEREDVVEAKQKSEPVPKPQRRKRPDYACNHCDMTFPTVMKKAIHCRYAHKRALLLSRDTTNGHHSADLGRADLASEVASSEMVKSPQPSGDRQVEIDNKAATDTAEEPREIVSVGEGVDGSVMNVGQLIEETDPQPLLNYDINSENALSKEVTLPRKDKNTSEEPKKSEDAVHDVTTERTGAVLGGIRESVLDQDTRKSINEVSPTPSDVGSKETVQGKEEGQTFDVILPLGENRGNEAMSSGINDADHQAVPETRHGANVALPFTTDRMAREDVLKGSYFKGSDEADAQENLDGSSGDDHVVAAGVVPARAILLPSETLSDWFIEAINNIDDMSGIRGVCDDSEFKVVNAQGEATFDKNGITDACNERCQSKHLDEIAGVYSTREDGKEASNLGSECSNNEKTSVSVAVCHISEEMVVQRGDLVKDVISGTGKRGSDNGRKTRTKDFISVVAQRQDTMSQGIECSFDTNVSDAASDKITEKTIKAKDSATAQSQKENVGSSDNVKEREFAKTGRENSNDNQSERIASVSEVKSSCSELVLKYSNDQENETSDMELTNREDNNVVYDSQEGTETASEPAMGIIERTDYATITKTKIEEQNDSQEVTETASEPAMDITEGTHHATIAKTKTEEENDSQEVTETASEPALDITEWTVTIAKSKIEEENNSVSGSGETKCETDGEMEFVTSTEFAPSIRHSPNDQGTSGTDLGEVQNKTNVMDAEAINMQGCAEDCIKGDNGNNSGVNDIEESKSVEESVCYMETLVPYELVTDTAESWNQETAIHIEDYIAGKEYNFTEIVQWKSEEGSVCDMKTAVQSGCDTEILESTNQEKTKHAEDCIEGITGQNVTVIVQSKCEEGRVCDLDNMTPSGCVTVHSANQEKDKRVEDCIEDMGCSITEIVQSKSEEEGVCDVENGVPAGCDTINSASHEKAKRAAGCFEDIREEYSITEIVQPKSEEGNVCDMENEAPSGCDNIISADQDQAQQVEEEGSTTGKITSCDSGDQRTSACESTNQSTNSCCDNNDKDGNDEEEEEESESTDERTEMAQSKSEEGNVCDTENAAPSGCDTISTADQDQT